MSVALAQPHRCGSRDQKCASALGRFFMRNPTLRAELFDAAEEYAGLVRRWRAAKGVPTDVRLGVGRNGDGPSDATVAAWARRIGEIELAMVTANRSGFLVVKWLSCEGLDTDRKYDAAACEAFYSLAVELGTISARTSAFAEPAVSRKGV